MTLPDLHLDLGCGRVPRNPYGRGVVCGVDIVKHGTCAGVELRTANLSIEPIPWLDDTFGSVSAFDFIEHVPRVLPTADGKSTTFPFISVMNEVWRVLAPGGRFYALTPCYPSAAAFQDPTHVNFITEMTHCYFTDWAQHCRMYGFIGDFKLLRAEWGLYRSSLTAEPLDLPQRLRRWSQLRRSLRLWNYRRKGLLTHFIWEFAAIKNGVGRTA